MTKKLTVIIGLTLLIVIPASARTDCSEVMEEKGQSAFNHCRAVQHEEDIRDQIETNNERIDDKREDIKDMFEDYIDDAEDYKEDLDLAFKRRERDEKRVLEDLEDDDAAGGVKDEQKERLENVKRERGITNKYYEIYVNILKKQRELEELRLDLEKAGYELGLRRR
ncbi:hypothetical protein KKG16_01045 [Patescibacteria group bacterium]|nr:hypothetical protein [Patescibacteria group bacterium]